MCVISKITFVTVLFSIIIYSSLLTSVRPTPNHSTSESHLILSSYLKLALKYTASSTTFDKSQASNSSLSPLSLIGLHIHDIANGHGGLFDVKTTIGITLSKDLKDTTKLKVLSAFQNFFELYQFFSMHPAFNENSSDLDVLPACYSSFDSCPFGACSVCSGSEPFNKTQFHSYARNIVASKFLTFDFGSESLLKRFAFGLVLMNTGYLDKAIEHFERFLKEFPNQPEALTALAIAQFRKDYQAFGNQAVNLLTEALRLQSKNADLYVKRAQIQFLIGNYAQAFNDMSNAINMNRTAWQLVLQRCLVNFALGESEAAFQDAKSAVRLHGRDPHLLLVLGAAYTRLGRLRNAAETYKEALEEAPDLVDARLRMADCHRVLGAGQRVVQLLTPLLSPADSAGGVRPDQTYAASKLAAMSHYSAGRCRQTLNYTDRCLALHPTCPVCLFRRAAALANLGQFYESIRASTAIMVQGSLAATAASPEFLRSHYLREWGRFLRGRLDTNWGLLNFTTDLQKDFRVRWILGKSLLESKVYREESGLQPSQEDVTVPDLTAYNFRQQELICLAKRVGQSFRTDTDGAVNNERVTFALGLAAVHIGQLVYNATHDRYNHNNIGWLSLIDLAAKYIQLADLTKPVQLVHTLLPKSEPSPTANSNAPDLQFNHAIVHRGVPNPPLQAYFNLVFQLAKTMTEHSRGPGSAGSQDEKREFDTAQTLGQVLAIAKRRRTYRDEDRGLVVGTQVPSTKYRDQMRHEGAYIYLTEDAKVGGSCSLGVRIRLRTLRLRSYRDELDHLLSELLGDMRAGRLANPGPDQVSEQAVSRVLTLLYYLTNAMPLSHRSGPAAFAVAVGLLLASNIGVGGRPPPGKSLELEPVLAGTPDAFALVTRQWLKPVALAKSVGAGADCLSVTAALPTLRSVLEMIGAGASADCPAA
ncbi:hypothetical protein BOX15_Mlig001952g1 [Macrostomum lignano]|uniref:Uncharacterized protein n=2 Tax=Macrostomum lignano TaxID=282301 RepID=A0A267FHN4_9PLAT|nr:hypothetical protein BOX15_Mlig001952g1 [Macrostomum lignano]